MLCLPGRASIFPSCFHSFIRKTSLDVLKTLCWLSMTCQPGSVPSEPGSAIKLGFWVFLLMNDIGMGAKKAFFSP